ncbi:STAS domain-containing protein [Runella slithyformis]|uniref:Sulfate transporter/antisigma-factor antagonist STAS n=1 Tax=Runella slithyformis (strain ATCC 29530 / DSM 19594 / LMG 11500 / NCIMB 11436 / LSU 4) TaxID=761193 RepID=A0A7U4E7V1_RUNSL|nr:STAS domain-containing protein [Runella slithyformis]AEI50713.1 sulfate transporter/antisigma-factor antagonist STAS [Runella slithyformis DSM 19594]
MNYVLQKHEQYALINIKETEGEGAFATDLETLSRELFREGFHNLIIDFTPTKTIDAAGISTLKKINMLCSRELGLMVLVSDDDNFVDQLIEGKIRDVTILPTVEEGIDAVFMNDLENEFGAESDDFDDEDFGEDGFTKSEQP